MLGFSTKWLKHLLAESYLCPELVQNNVLGLESQLLDRLREEDYEFKASLDVLLRAWFKMKSEEKARDVAPW